MKDNLIIFVKYPEPGKVKTRIAKAVGNEKAADLYFSLASHVVNEVTGSDGFKVSIAFTPQSRESLIKNWLNKDELDYFPQNGRTLGERISGAFERSFANGFKNAAVIGSDCAELDHRTIKTAFSHLSNGSDCVIGPAHDGGYYLIGLRDKNFPYIFEDISWSSASVFDETVKKLTSLDLKFSVLRKLSDIDNAGDIDDNLIKLLKGPTL